MKTKMRSKSDFLPCADAEASIRSFIPVRHRVMASSQQGDWQRSCTYFTTRACQGSYLFLQKQRE